MTDDTKQTQHKTMARNENSAKASAAALPSFDDLMELAREKPDELEELRQSITRDLIQSAPDHMRDRLNGLQFRIDMERERSACAVGSCVRISSMMNESLSQLREVLSNPSEFIRNQAQHEAEVISFMEAREQSSS